MPDRQSAPRAYPAVRRHVVTLAGAAVAAALVAVPVSLAWPTWKRFVDFSVDTGGFPAVLELTIRVSGNAGLWQLVAIAAVLGAVAARRWTDRH